MFSPKFYNKNDKLNAHFKQSIINVITRANLPCKKKALNIYEQLTE